MPPQQQNQPTMTPGPGGNLDPNYGFIFNGQKQPKKRLNFNLLPSGNNLTKITMLIVGVGAVLGILIIILSSVFGSKGVDTNQLVGIAARAREINRVSDLVLQQSNDTNTDNLAATTANSLSSEQAGIFAYLNGLHIKVNIKELGVYQDKNTDTELQTAAQNNSLSSYYNSYLKKQLTTYQNELKTTFDATKSSKLQAILKDAYSSTNVVLTSQQVASAASQ
jgi:hypothetical protein